MTASAVLAALRNVVDPMSTHLKELYLNGQGIPSGGFDLVTE